MIKPVRRAANPDRVPSPQGVTSAPGVRPAQQRAGASDWAASAAPKKLDLTGASARQALPRGDALTAPGREPISRVLSRAVGEIAARGARNEPGGTSVAQEAAEALAGHLNLGTDGAFNCTEAALHVQDALAQAGWRADLVLTRSGTGGAHALLALPGGGYFDPTRAAQGLSGTLSSLPGPAIGRVTLFERRALFAAAQEPRKNETPKQAVARALRVIGLEAPKVRANDTSADLEAIDTPFERERMGGVERFVGAMATMLKLDHVPKVVLDRGLPTAGYFDERTNMISVRPETLEYKGDRARGILAHEMIHAWQNQSKLFDWNLPDSGAYVNAPKGPLWKTILNPIKYLQLMAYALQPVELHAELDRMFLTLTGRLPPAPW